ncbi:MAG: hypothetical protein ABEJ60_05100 [Halodesulfurarchaeum sp.]
MGEDPDASRPRWGGTDRDRGAESSGTLVLSEEEVHVGDTITLKGRNFPSDTRLDLVWNSFEGDWGVLQAKEVVGPQFRPRTDLLETVTVDESGAFDWEFEVPQDYGGEHTIEVRDETEDTLATVTLAIHPWFDIDRREATSGEWFRITGHGLGPNVVHNDYQVTWDNGYVGFMTGVKNRGTATADIRAVGPVGEHVIQVWRNYRGTPQIQNNTQSPYGAVGGDRASSWVVEVTERETEPHRCWVDDLFDEEPIASHFPDVSEDTDASLQITPTSGQVGTEATVTGRNFPPHTQVDLVWYDHTGSYVEGIPISLTPRPGLLPTVVSDAEGSIEAEITIPEATGATRPIVAMVEGPSVAVTGFVLQPSIETFSPREGPVGTEITIELGGLGWTGYENNYHVVYDNRPLGYISGTMGDDPGEPAKTQIKATGEPGYHYIDIYPGIFEMQEDYPDFELKPHLSYLDNHPVRPLPALHLAFEITE